MYLCKVITDTLKTRGDLPDKDLKELLETTDTSLVQKLKNSAREVSVAVFGREIYLRGLVEWSNVCRNDCLYCGIRRSNSVPRRYRLTPEEILACGERIHAAGIRTIVLQGGENPSGAESLVPVVAEIRRRYPDTAITLSLGELPFDTYRRLREAGADRYLLRHETASERHYARLHPQGMRLESRLACLEELRRLGFQTGMGMMVGSPFQTTEDLLADIRLLQRFRPQMIGCGPFIPQQDTPFAGYAAGSAETTLRLYAILRLMLPHALIPATTALSTLLPDGHAQGILSGANVIMPSFTPVSDRDDYTLYDHKSRESLPSILRTLSSIGYHAGASRGDYR